MDCGFWCTCFITKTEVFFFLICALRIVIFGREFSLSTLTFHFFIYSFIRFFIYTNSSSCEKKRKMKSGKEELANAIKKSSSLSI